MSQITFFTPSHSRDLDRLFLLRESIRRFYRGSARHIVAVPAREMSYFRKHVKDDSVIFVTQESMVDPIFYPTLWYLAVKKLCPGQSWRFRRFSGRAGWFIQQIVKLSATRVVETPVIVVLDSDFVFMRRFCDRNFLGQDTSSWSLYRSEPESESGKHREVMRRARQILALPPGSDEYHYIGWPIVWYVDWLQGLTDSIESAHGKQWQQVLFEAELFSEYCLYGVYVEEVLKAYNLIVTTARRYDVVWDDKSFDELVRGYNDNSLTDTRRIRLGIVIQSNLHKPVNEYRQKIYEIWDRTS